MKKIISTALTFLMCLSAITIAAFATHPITQVYEVTRYQDGTYAEITTTVYGTLVRTSSQCAEKAYVYKTAGGTKLFTYTLKACFSYDGSSSSCTSASASANIHKDGWNVISHDEHYSGNIAYGNASFSAPSESKNVSLTLTCDKNGNIS